MLKQDCYNEALALAWSFHEGKAKAVVGKLDKSDYSRSFIISKAKKTCACIARHVIFENNFFFCSNFCDLWLCCESINCSANKIISLSCATLSAGLSGDPKKRKSVVADTVRFGLVVRNRKQAGQETIFLYS